MVDVMKHDNFKQLITHDPNKINTHSHYWNQIFKHKLNETNKWMKTMICFLPLNLVFAHKPFSTLFERILKKKCILTYMWKCQIPSKNSC
jgi:hypothetical protein